MHTLVITLQVGSDKVVHRARNVAEDLQRAFATGEVAAVSLDEIDRMTDCLHVRVRAIRHLGEAERLIQSMLRRHGLSAKIYRL